MPKDGTLKIFKELGLILFLAGAGVSGGEKFVALFKPEYFIYGIVITIADEFDIPVKFIGVGEGMDDLKEFDAKEFTEALFN
jgi:uncharacterized transporter YbjL